MKQKLAEAPKEIATRAASEFALETLTANSEAARVAISFGASASFCFTAAAAASGPVRSPRRRHSNSRAVRLRGRPRAPARRRCARAAEFRKPAHFAQRSPGARRCVGAERRAVQLPRSRPGRTETMQARNERRPRFLRRLERRSDRGGVGPPTRVAVELIHGREQHRWNCRCRPCLLSSDARQARRFLADAVASENEHIGRVVFSPPNNAARCSAMAMPTALRP